jgi:hypothetical protein
VIGSRVEIEPTLTIRPQHAPAHPGDDGAGEHPRSEHQRAIGALPLVELMVERAAERRPAGVGDEDVDRPERLLDLARQRREPRGVGGIGDERRRPRADLRHRLLEPLPRAAGDRDPRALAHQHRRDPPPNSATGPHHQRHPSLEPQIHPPTLPEPCRSKPAAWVQFPMGARSSVVNGSFRGAKERRSFKPKVAGSTPVGRIRCCSLRVPGFSRCGARSWASPLNCVPPSSGRFRGVPARRGRILVSSPLGSKQAIGG